MDLGIRFPTVEEKVLEETAQFRALPQRDRNRELGSLFQLYHDLAARSPHAGRLADAEEMQSRQSILEAAGVSCR